MTQGARSADTRRHRVLVASPFAAGSVAVVALASAWSQGRLSTDVWMTVCGMLAFTTVGALIESRRPHHVVGRICLAIGWLLVLTALLGITVAALEARPGRAPWLEAVLAMLASTSFAVALLMCGPVLISRFPDGRDAGRLPLVVDVLLGVTAIGIAMRMFQPGLIGLAWIGLVDNPLGVAWLPARGSDIDNVGFFFLYVVTTVLAAVGLVRRYRRGGPVVRSQVRWFVASIAVSIALLTVMLTTGGVEPLNSIAWNVWAVSLFLPAVAIGVAILRYRLYDIDRIVSNTIGYGLVTLVLVAVFVLVNVALVSRLSPMFGNEGPAVAASTLVVAALFNPLRIRVQRVVDRRFHRAHYDAERTIAEFAGRLRGELDLPTLAAELASTTARAVQPTTTGLWLRKAGR